MILLNMNSGLGNQMFQYAFYLTLKELNPEDEVYVDTSIYRCSNMQSKYEIEKIFDIELPNISTLVSSDSFKSFCEQSVKIVESLPRNWLSKGAFLSHKLLVNMLRENNLVDDCEIITDLVSEHNPSVEYKLRLQLRAMPIVADLFYRIKKNNTGYNMRHYYEEIRKVTNIDNTRIEDFEYIRKILVSNGENKYFIGNFENGTQYFRNSQDKIRRAFSFPRLDPKNQQFAKAEESTNSVSIHIRRGDHMAENQHLFDVGGYYQQAVAYIKQHVDNPRFFIFSDDISWCKTNLSSLGITDKQAVLVQGNSGSNSFRDMQLMSLCKHNIIPISTFSWWGSFLNDNREKITIAPKNFWCDARIYI